MKRIAVLIRGERKSHPPIAEFSTGLFVRFHNLLPLRGLSLSATLMITEGDPALEILGEAERCEYDLIVIGATGEDDLKHELLGSVSTKVTQDALCSTLVVKF